MPKAKSKKTSSAPGLTDVTIPGPSRPLIPKSRGVLTAREPARGGRFWRPSSTAVKLEFTPVYRRWLREGLPDEFKPNYGMGTMNAKIEEVTGNALLVSGPLMDYHLTLIGEAVASRLRRRNSTGMATFHQNVAPALFSHMMLLMSRYGAEVHHTGGTGMYGTVELRVRDLGVLNSILDGARSDGRRHTSKLHFDTERTPDGEVIDHYRGKTLVVASETRPFQMTYRSRSGKLTVRFYRQKYDRNGLAEDTTI
ncbi:Hypp8162 [Branchiostoma lanceolatum]|uniref:Hypp8162 protein n=1 Tax=Branchiostoma lanceolatum TaxID=7740 RepID=A0A8K0EEB0_BRALA|nr:Hypp8162 [Branchiostoma lanceolatum]